ncbi:nucleotide-diphospho-sugar transferase [Schizophyllum amplum]|uniref:Translation initiation factor eIF2B subunit gamma n=1 Tax=Schizophyllum amplum TaxID=97359 RepID=A0A550CXX9_9AGAR|nr:nucleotide-diphospho-sugar transferase [Auriculariopsis ampla]
MDIIEERSLVSREFLAVILCGFGNELHPLTSNNGDEPCPKALLPVANKPIIDYTLAWVEQARIQDVLVICPTTHRTAISHHIDSDISSSSTVLRIDVQTFDESQDASIGTSTVLRHFASRIQGDFILLPCDFIPPPSLPLSVLLDKFRTEALADGAIATTCWFATPKKHEKDKSLTPDEWGPAVAPTAIVWDDASGTLLHVDTPDAIDDNADDMELRMALLDRYPHTKLSSGFTDSHVYICKRTVLDALVDKPLFESFREDLLPWLCKIQYQRTKHRKYGQLLHPKTSVITQDLSLSHSTLRINSTQNADDTEDSEEVQDTPASLRVGVVLFRPSGPEEHVARINNIHSFFETNRHCLTTASWTLPSEPKARSLIDAKAQISTDSIIGTSTQIAERASIKRSTIGKHCVIGKMAKITGCVLLDHCVVEDGAKLEGSILGKNTKVGAKADVSKCVTQAGYEVPAGETVKNEKLDVSDWTAVSEEGDDEDDEDEDEDASESSDDST